MRGETARFDALFRTLLASASLAALIALAAPAAADAVRVEALPEGDRARIILTWPSPVGMQSEVRDGRLVLRFDRPVDGDFDAIAKLSAFVAAPSLDGDRRAVSFPLRPGIAGVAYSNDRSIIVDLIRGNAAAIEQPAARGAPADAGVAAVPTIPVSTGQHRGFSRIVFDWDRPVGYRIERTVDGATVVFDRPAEIDARNFDRRYLKYLRGGDSQRSDSETRINLRISTESGVRDQRDGRKVVIDILAPIPGPQQTAEPAPAPPAASLPSPVTPPPLPAEEQRVGKAGAPAASRALLPDHAHDAAPMVATAPPAAPSSSPEPAAPPSPASSEKAKKEEEQSTLRIDWDRPVAAAVFRRGDATWAVFDQPSQRDLVALAQTARGGVVRIDQRPNEHATVLRIETRAGMRPQIDRDGLTWILRFVTDDPKATTAIIPVVEETPQHGTRLLLPVAQPGEPLPLDDPAAGEIMVVVPVIPRSAHIARNWTYPQFRLAETAQGIVVQPRIDSLRVRSLAEGVEISSSDGLAVSLVKVDTEASASQRLLDTRDWTAGHGGSFVVQRRALERAVVDAEAADREPGRLRLAQFLLGRGFATEAIGTLQVAAQQRPNLAAEPRFLLLRGAANLLAGRVHEARDDLLQASAKSASGEVRMWAVAARTATGEPVDAGDLTALRSWTVTVLSYPAELRGPLATLLAEAAIAGGQAGEAQPLIEISRQTAVGGQARARLAYLEGRLKEKNGEIDGAITAYEEAARLDPRRGRAQADLARTLLRLREGQITPAEATAALDALRHVWRGDDVEFQVLCELGRLQLQAADYSAGLRTLKLAVSEYPNLSGAAEATREMAATFERLFLEGRADGLPSVTALGLWEEFKELTPPGDKGREMVRKLADRLVAVDLLERAAALLESLLPAASGTERAYLGARLAEVQLLDAKPEAALDALRRTASTGLAAELQRTRAVVQGRALYALGHRDEALAVVAHDDGIDAELLRARAFRASGEWARAATSLKQIVEAARADPLTPLDDRRARDVLDLAVALTLAGNTTQLAQLDANYRGAMAETPLRDVFRLIAGTVPPPDADAKSLADLLESAIAFRRALSSSAAPAPAR